MSSSVYAYKTALAALQKCACKLWRDLPGDTVFSKIRINWSDMVGDFVYARALL